MMRKYDFKRLLACILAALFVLSMSLSTAADFESTTENAAPVNTNHVNETEPDVNTPFITRTDFDTGSYNEDLTDISDDYVAESGEKGPVDPFVHISQSNLTINKGQAYQLTAYADIPGALSWSSSNTTIATVTSYGLVVGISNGIAYIDVEVDTNEVGIVIDRCLVYVTSNAIIEDGDYFIRNVQANKYMTVNDLNDNSIFIYSLQDKINYRWHLALQTDGYYRIKSAKSNKYANVDFNNPLPGANIKQTDNISEGSKWAIMITSSGNYAFVPKSSTFSFVVMGVTGTSDDTGLQTVTYTNNTDKKDEWVPVRMLPLSGSELAYSASAWNDSDFNDYQYILNCQAKPWNTSVKWLSPDPGDYSHTNISGYGTNHSILTSAVSADVNEYNSDHNTMSYLFYSVNKYTACLLGTYKVALFISSKTTGGVTTYGYHFYRQDSDGFWSWLSNTGSATRVDSSDVPIIDPETAAKADWGADSISFVGYYAVTPWNHMIY